MGSRLNPNSLKSKRRGLFRFLENILRRFNNLGMVLIFFPIPIFYIISLGVALSPCLFFLYWIREKTVLYSFYTQVSAIAFGLGVSFWIFTVSLILIVSCLNFLLKPFVKKFKGAWFSLAVAPWCFHNSLFYLVRFTVLNFITPSPLSTFFLKMMGMKIGKGSLVNTTNISDPLMIEIGKNTIVGGSATLIAHYAIGGYLNIDKLVIGNNVTIGLQAKLLGSSTIEDNVIVAPNAVVLPKVKIKKGERFGF